MQSGRGSDLASLAAPSIDPSVPEEGLPVLLIGLIFILAIPVLYLAVSAILAHVRKVREKGVIEQLNKEASGHEKAGRFVSAAVIYEKLKQYERAAGLFEKGGDYLKAADIFGSMGRFEKMRDLYEKAGDLEKAAGACMRGGLYIDAARIYTQRGEVLQAAEALEMSGNRLAAVRAYREAKKYVRAAFLLKEEGMFREAAEMYGISVAGSEVNKENIDRFYVYAELLRSAGMEEKARDVYLDIMKTDAGYKNVQDRLSVIPTEGERAVEKEGVSARPQAGEEDGRRTLRRLMDTASMGPKDILKLWMNILRALDKRHKAGLFLSNLCPDNIIIDRNNAVYFEEEAPKVFSYSAPECISGGAADQTSEIYSMGVILYEMLAGGLDSFGLKRPGQAGSAVPDWLDEITIRCIQRDREKRYQSIEEIIESLTSLKGRT